MGRECPHCRRWLSNGDLIQGYCWDCKATLNADGSPYKPDNERGGDAGDE